ncbi:MAG: iron ABC transporter permease [Pseudomonadota bacterium]
MSAGLMGVLSGGGETWAHISGTTLSTYAGSTVVMLVLTGILVLVFAIPAAWLVTMHEFPGRRFLEWLLILPLAAPAYVLAIAYANLLGVAGPVQSGLRDMTGLSARDYWFPDINSLPGLSVILAAALYPYVYLAARAAFTTTSICTLDAARTLGARPRDLLLRVALPAARPAIIAGLSLALMEAAADYGAADYLGVQTLTVGVFRAWSSYGDVGAGARLALILLALAVFLQWLERFDRGSAGSEATSKRWQSLTRARLNGWHGWAAAGFCFALFSLGFGIPVLRLLWIAIDTNAPVASLSGAAVNSILLAAAGASLAFIAGLAVALGARRKTGLSRLARLAASGGYAVPGAVLALGGLIVIGWLGLGLTGHVALLVLIWIYVCRFTVAGAEPMQAALARAPKSMDQAARSLAASPLRRLVRVDLPIAMSGAVVAALILFVEILKELPATLMLRPTGWDTLAVRAYGYASDERVAEATVPCLLITLAGLVPVILLSVRLSRARPGETA